MFGLHKRNRGSAVLVIMFVLGIMMVFIVANTRIVWSLRQELKLVEQRQVKHWAGSATNSPVVTGITNAPAVQP